MAWSSKGKSKKRDSKKVAAIVRKALAGADVTEEFEKLDKGIEPVTGMFVGDKDSGYLYYGLDKKKKFTWFETPEVDDGLPYLMIDGRQVKKPSWWHEDNKVDERQVDKVIAEERAKGNVVWKETKTYDEERPKNSVVQRVVDWILPGVIGSPNLADVSESTEIPETSEEAKIMPLNALQAKQKEMIAEFEKNTKDRIRSRAARKENEEYNDWLSRNI